MRTHLDLFAGIGGFSLGLEACGFKSIAFSEVDPVASFVYRAHFPESLPIGDITKVDWAEFCDTHGTPFIVTGGVPCQPASTLGRMRGTADERWLWPEVIRMVREVRPRYAIFENPPSLLVLEGGRAWNGIVSGLVSCGYDLWWDVFPAAAFGAGHLRERVILVCTYAGHATAPAECERECNEMGRKQFDRELGPGEVAANGNSECRRDRAGRKDGEKASNCRSFVADSSRQQTHERGVGDVATTQGRGQGLDQTAGTGCENAPDAMRPRLEGHAGNGVGSNIAGGGSEETRRHVAPPDLRGRVNCEEWWHEANTSIPVLAHGIPAKLVEAACRCFGNAIIPQIPYLIGQAINEVEKKEKNRCLTSTP